MSRCPRSPPARQQAATPAGAPCHPECLRFAERRSLALAGGCACKRHLQRDDQRLCERGPASACPQSLRCGEQSLRAQAAGSLSTACGWGACWTIGARSNVWCTFWRTNALLAADASAPLAADASAPRVALALADRIAVGLTKKSLPYRLTVVHKQSEIKAGWGRCCRRTMKQGTRGCPHDTRLAAALFSRAASGGAPGSLAPGAPAPASHECRRALVRRAGGRQGRVTSQPAPAALPQLPSCSSTGAGRSRAGGGAR